MLPDRNETNFPTCVLHGRELHPLNLSVAKTLFDLSRSILESSKMLRQTIIESESRIKETQKTVSFLEMVKSLNGIDSEKLDLPNLKKGILEGEGLIVLLKKNGYQTEQLK